jgi:Vault protein inter-alpha-trypsin domain
LINSSLCREVYYRGGSHASPTRRIIIIVGIFARRALRRSRIPWPFKRVCANERCEIKRRAEAQQLFAQVRTEGRVAALLDQERPNLFTQAVTNISPGAAVKVTISYVETLPYEDGVYQFTFPMVAGERYIPGEKPGDDPDDGKVGTDQVPDAARIKPPRVPKGKRPGHDISLEVAIDTGVPLEQITSELHEIEVDRDSHHQAVSGEVLFLNHAIGCLRRMVEIIGNQLS